MLKNNAFKRIIIASLALIILGLLYFFPTKNTQKPIKQSLSYTKPLVTAIYLIDNNNYVARTNIIKNTNDALELAKSNIEALTIDGAKKDYLPQGFKAIIPKNTKIINISITQNILKINFTKEFLNISKENEEKLLESLIYTLTEINGIDKIMIFIEGEQLTKLPNSNKILPQTLDRSFGINKVYDLTSFKNITTTTLYYLSKYNDNYYYVPVTKITNSNKEKVEIIIEELKSAPINQTNLISFLTANAELEEYEILKNSVSLSFNNLVFDSFKDKEMLEEVKYSIGLSIKDSYSVSKVIFNMDGKEIMVF